MLRTRVIPCLLLRDESLVKTVNFHKFNYIGDPANTVRIFNELEVDELAFLDISAHHPSKKINFDVLQEIANECFMPLSYGGGISSVEDAEDIFSIGFEKIIINTNAVISPQLVTRLAEKFGSQSIIGSLDVKKNVWGSYKVMIKSATTGSGLEPVSWAKKLEELGVGELLLTSVDQEGTWKGFDQKLTRSVSDAVGIPVIASGGGGNLNDVESIIKKGHASAVALGSMVVYQKKGYGVLVNFPDRLELEERLSL